MTNATTSAFVAAMAESKAEAPKAEAPKAEAPKAQGFGSKLDEAKAKTEAKEALMRSVAKIQVKDASQLEKALEEEILEQSIHAFAHEFKKGESKAAIVWTQIRKDLETRFGLSEEQSSIWYTYTSANCRGNERGIWERLEYIRKEVQAAAKSRGVDGVDMPWKHIRDYGRRQKAKETGGTPRTSKPLDERQKKLLTTLYTAGMKEERPTDLEFEVNDAIGLILRDKFKLVLADLEK